MSISSISTLIVGYLSNIVELDVSKTPKVVTADNAATAQLLYSELVRVETLLGPNDITEKELADLRSIVCEVALTKKQVISSDPRAQQVKSIIIAQNLLVPVNIRYTNPQLDNIFAALAPF